ncbi:FAD-binding oxidoreductase [Streptomyces kaniharaensis]|uniref:FAD-binding oxidoreductase n=1 Tax=Streptomyces kaniharaensis TaxID=212423 RepID=A0A6N7L512_9ACTN|nr:FAD-dependent oxidoreductase [Streptomyces kaniharaensis]MQS17013.1 FAD-binding oxidoreductase [Streptomyces kaniharaensis]
MTVSPPDAVVVGAGVIGAAVALELARGGRRVVVVDKGGAAGHGSTSASSAIIRFNYSTFASVATAWEAHHIWASWPDHLRLTGRRPLAAFHRTGAVLLDAPGAAPASAIALFDRAGVPYERWDTPTLRRRLPGIDPGRYWPPKPVDDDAFFAEPTGELGALITPDAGFVDDPQLAAQNLADAAGALGARFLFHHTVTGVDRRAHRVAGIRLADGTKIAAPVVVNAAGPWSGGLNRLAGVEGDFTVGVRPLRQEVHQVAAPGGYATGSGLGPVVADLDLGTYMRAAPGGRLLVGGTQPACDPPEWIDDPDAADPRPTANRFRTQVTRAARRFPGLAVPNRPLGVAGVYDVADDWTPIYDRTALDGYYVAMGTSGNQFKNAPLVGRFLASLIDRVEAGQDHDHEPVRHRCEHTGNVVDLGAFSRRRPVREGSPRTVMG